MIAERRMMISKAWCNSTHRERMEAGKRSPLEEWLPPAVFTDKMRPCFFLQNRTSGPNKHDQIRELGYGGKNIPRLWILGINMRM